MSDTREKLEQMGFRILDAVRTELLLSMRFMAPALNSLGFKMDLATSSAGTDAAYIRFNPGFLLQVYVERPRRMNRMYMHMLIHCLFRHMFSARDREDPELWDLCCDIAAESVVDSMTYDVIARSHSTFREGWYEKLKSEITILTAEKIYAWFLERDRDYAMEEALRKSLTLGYTSVRIFMKYSNLKRDSAKQYLDSLCKGDHPRLLKVKHGHLWHYFLKDSTP